jgi:metallo-beta-lactamase family protein
VHASSLSVVSQLERISVKLTFLGANRQVTGSRYCLEAGGSRIMIDCGLFQEREFLSRNWEPCPLPAERFDALLLTHAHIDHSGLIPKLVREGFRGPIYTTAPSVQLCDVMLRDSARIQEEDAAYKKRRHRREGRRGKYPERPLYVERDVERALRLFRAVRYDEPVRINDAFTVVFRDAGHILGSSMLQVEVAEGGTTRSIVFSGDVGQWNKPLVRDPSTFERADYVVMESTYGDRNHGAGGRIEEQLKAVIQATVECGGNVVIPTFAVERAQELMYYISRLVYADAIPDIPVYLDSPMAVDVTHLFNDFRSALDDEARELFRSNHAPLRFPGLRMVQSTDDSKAINRVNGPCIIMAASGMCTGGRIKHHLRHNIGRPECTVLFVGHQGRGTLGRQILDGASPVRIHGQMYGVKARVARIEGFSAHADQAGLMHWLAGFRSAPRQLFLTHGEEEVSLHLAEHVKGTLDWPVTVPHYMEEVDLA